LNRGDEVNDTGGMVEVQDLEEKRKRKDPRLFF